MLDWEAPANEVLINPRMPDADRAELLSTLKVYDGFTRHVWMLTSGTSGRLKCAALSKEAILASAEAVNRHLQSTSSDVWFNPLPSFHVGGLGIWARGYLCGAKVIDGWKGSKCWNALQFVDRMAASKATLTSLVPTQVFDLLAHRLSAPPSLRAVIVGGGALSEKLYFESIRLGWKLLPSYGLTECASQVATAVLESWETAAFPLLYPLDHVLLALDDQGRLKIKSPSLLTAIAEKDVVGSLWKVSDPKCDGWLITDDQAEVDNGAIKAISRKGGFVKIGGESVDLGRLEKILEEVKLENRVTRDMAIFAFPDERLGHVVHLAMEIVESSYNVQFILDAYHKKVLPFERIRHVHFIDQIPRSSLNKLLTNELITLLAPALLH